MKLCVLLVGMMMMAPTVNAINCSDVSCRDMPGSSQLKSMEVCYLDENDNEIRFEICYCVYYIELQAKYFEVVKAEMNGYYFNVGRWPDDLYWAFRALLDAENDCGGFPEQECSGDGLIDMEAIEITRTCWRWEIEGYVQPPFGHGNDPVPLYGLYPCDEMTCVYNWLSNGCEWIEEPSPGKCCLIMEDFNAQIIRTCAEEDCIQGCRTSNPGGQLCNPQSCILIPWE